MAEGGAEAAAAAQAATDVSRGAAAEEPPPEESLREGSSWAPDPHNRDSRSAEPHSLGQPAGSAAPPGGARRHGAAPPPASDLPRAKRRRAQAPRGAPADASSEGGPGAALALADISRDSAAAAAPEDDAPPLAPAAEESRAAEAARLRSELDSAQSRCDAQQTRLNASQRALRTSRRATAGLLVQQARAEAAEERERLALTRAQLGVYRHVAGAAYSWEGGYEEAEIARLKERIQNDKRAIQSLRTRLSKKSRAAGGAGTPAKGEAREEVGDAGGEEGDEADELWESREISTCRMSFLNREEGLLKEREQRLSVERNLFFKRQQLNEMAQRSTFGDYRLLAGSGSMQTQEQYQLLNMIGKGGFSEVYRAYDLDSGIFCAVKIHELGRDMTDAQRQSYVKRATRELEIQKSVKHPRVVSFLNWIPISNQAFGTVLELVDGDTLDEYIKRNGAVSEKEARGIVIQIFSGLKYMNTGGRKIIHYDLKPGNLFYHFGEIRITDFGLSKKVDKEHAASIDNTSQGAGTYWYLPPECMVDIGQREAGRISNKVDVWSTGVIFFELLVARRPFGHGQSQEALRRAANSAFQQFSVEFPAGPKDPKVPNEAKDFIRRLLTYDREQRPDVLEAFNDPYLRSRGQRPGAVAAPAAAAAAG